MTFYNMPDGYGGGTQCDEEFTCPACLENFSVSGTNDLGAWAPDHDLICPHCGFDLDDDPPEDND